ncbi:MAG: methyltransferase domain-containing protein [Planctomycetota bacterium]|nr:methyltransferase domain-containing protein [Planctomycetota bacterium]
MGIWSAFAEHYERVFRPRPDAVEWLVGWARSAGREVAPGASCALDFGCGTGHDAAGLAAGGLDVLAMDLDPAMIDEARRLHEGQARLCFEVAGLSDFVAPLRRWAAAAARGEDAGLDLAVCIGNVAAHLDEEQLAGFLAELRPRLTKGSVLVLQTVNFDRILAAGSEAGRFDFPVLEDPAKGDLPALRFERSYERLTEDGCEFHTRLLVDGELAFEGSTPMVPHRAAAVDRLAEAAGFTSIERRGGFGRAPFDPATSGPAVAILHS